MINAEKVLAYLRSIAPAEATISEIVRRTGVKPHQQVYQITQRLMVGRSIRGSEAGGEWRFWVDEPQAADSHRDVAEIPSTPGLTLSAPRAFEALARRTMSDHYGVPLAPRKLSKVRKTFDLVSPDANVVGDAKFFTMVGGERLPPAKFSVIAEHVWLLERTGAARTFLVFGNDRRVPCEWLQRYGDLLVSTNFHFINNHGKLETLAEPDNPSAEI